MLPVSVMVGLTSKKPSVLQKQIPTLLGVIVLVLGLGVGIFFFSDGLGVFAPRAAPESTPRTIKTTNISDTGFSVTFLTDSATPGYIRYGTSPDNLELRAGDDRDQLSGSIGSYTVHHITARELEPDTQYFFKLGTTGSELFDQEGQAYTITTSPRGGTPPSAKTIYGSVVTATGTPAEGSMVFATIPGAGQLSSLVQSSGSWAIPLSRARTVDSGTYITADDSTLVELFVQGDRASLTSTLSTTVGTGQPVATITLGQAQAAVNTDTSNDSSLNENSLTEITTNATSDTASSSGINASIDPTSGEFTFSGTLDTQGFNDLIQASATLSAELAPGVTPPVVENFIVDLTNTTKEIVTTSQPLIVGEAAPQVTVTIQVNSDTQINDQLIANPDGSFEIDISKYEQELEPGEHSITYSYVDPATGQTVTKTKNFTVAPRANDTSSLIALASPSPTPLAAVKASPSPSPSASPSAYPYSSYNPVPVGGVATRSATATSSGVATRSSQIATSSALPRSGSVGTTAALALAGCFFMIAGGWSLWASREWAKEHSV